MVDDSLGFPLVATTEAEPGEKTHNVGEWLCLRNSAAIGGFEELIEMRNIDIGVDVDDGEIGSLLKKLQCRALPYSVTKKGPAVTLSSMSP